MDRLFRVEHGFVVERSFTYHNTPVKMTPRPLAQRAMRTAANGLKSAGLLGPAASIYFRLKHLTMRNTDAQRLLADPAPPVMAPPEPKFFLARDRAAANR